MNILQNTEVREALLNILFTVITTLIPVVLGYVVVLIKKKTEQLTQSIENEKLKEYIKLAMNSISDAVVVVNQTYVDSLKNSGKFTKVNHLEAFDKAKLLAMKLITDESKQAIETVYGDFQLFIETQLEREVNSHK